MNATKGTGNVFADLRVKGAEEALAKAKLAHAISAIVAKQHLTQREAARRLGIDQPKVSALVRGHFEGFTIDRLIRFLVALDQDVDIVVKQARRRRIPARVNVVAVA
jgi:predicted XRE-type DNA-binding protein